MSTHTLSATAVTLTGGTAGTARLHLAGLAPGERGTESVTVHYKDEADAAVALYTPRADLDGGPAGPLARQVRIGVFERSRDLLPFPVFTGTLADLTEHDRFERGIGRWTARGDGVDHEVTYEITWRLPRHVTGLDGQAADIDLAFEAHGPDGR